MDKTQEYLEGGLTLGGTYHPETEVPRFNGVQYFDDVRIYNKALTDEEVAQLYAPDTDGDGVTDAQEAIDGTDPRILRRLKPRQPSVPILGQAWQPLTLWT